MQQIVTYFRTREVFVTGYMSIVRDCWFQHNGETGHIAKNTALLQEFFSEGIVGHQTLIYQTHFCGIFLKTEFITIAHGVWRKLNKVLKRRLLSLTQKHDIH